MTTRRTFLSYLGLSMPLALVAARPAKAIEMVTAAKDAGIKTSPVAGGLWETLTHVTDGTDPSTAVVEAPRFTPDIRALAGKTVELQGYLQSIGGGFGGTQTYVLSQAPYHCPYCYTQGRGSLALVEVRKHIDATDKMVTVKGVMTLQDADPADYYLQIKEAEIA